jgi:anti-anti-sigma factor
MENLKNKQQPSQPMVIEGELTIYTVTELKDKLLSELAKAEKMALDLSEVSEFDAAGLQLLVTIKKEAEALGKVLEMTGHSPVVVELLDLSGLAGFFGDPLLIVRKPIQEGNST